MIVCQGINPCLYSIRIYSAIWSRPAARSNFFSGASVSVASVSRSTVETDTAFSSAIRTTFVRVNDSRFDEVAILLARCVKAVVAAATPHSVDDNTAVYR